YWQRGTPTTSNAIIIAVIRESSANTVQVSDDIQAALKGLRHEIPGSIGMSVLYDQSVSIVASIDDVQETLLIAFVLVVLVIFVFLARPTDTLVPVVALPMSVVMTVIFMKLLGFSLDNLSLLAIMLAIGFVVDDAIVVLENTVRHIEHGQKPIDAAIDGAKEIGTTVLSMSITLVAVFIPLIFMPGVMGLMLREFSITIVLAILSSAIVSLTLSPLMCSYFLKSEGIKTKNAFEKWADHLMEGMIAAYSKLLSWFLIHRKTAILIWASCIAGTFYIGGLLPKTFLPPGDSGALFGSFVAENGTSPARMKELQKELEEVMQGNPYVVRTYTVTGVTSILTGNQGMLFAALCPKPERPDIQIICNQVNKSMAQHVPGVRAGLAPIPMISFNTGSNTNTSGAAGTQYQFEISGNITLEQTYEYATALYDQVKKIPGIVHPICELDNDNSQLTIEILRDQASALGVSAMAIERALDEAYANYIASYIRTPINLFWVIVEAADKDRVWPQDLNSIYVQSNLGFQVPLLSVVNPVVSLGPSMIRHKNQQNMAMVSFALGEDMALGTATDAVAKAANEVLPGTVIAQFSGDAATFKQTTQNMAFLLLVAIFTMYIVLGILYES
ncbi:MAG TPA: efflux RND transporter permease subunit, partial [Opitutales bacterium]|nr:efflux RND transporter permease subunit [Opitutales bacterium]